MRKSGVHMSKDDLLKALGILKNYFQSTLPKGVKPQIVFHGAEPTLNREALFAGLEEFHDDFRFGIQTNWYAALRRHSDATSEECGVIKVHLRRCVRRLPLLRRERLEHRAARAGIELAEAAIVGRGGGPLKRDDHAAVDLRPFDTEDPVGGAQHDQPEADHRSSSRYICQEASFLESRLRREGMENNAARAICSLPTHDDILFATRVLITTTILKTISRFVPQRSSLATAVLEPREEICHDHFFFARL